MLVPSLRMRKKLEYPPPPGGSIMRESRNFRQGEGEGVRKKNSDNVF